MVQECLRTLVERYLSLYLFENACFLCERLFAHEPSAENLNLLANCYMRANKYHRAYHVLRKDIKTLRHEKSDIHRSNAYLFASCCYKLGFLKEAEGALLEDNTGIQLDGPKKNGDVLFGTNNIPNGSAGLYLLGRICLAEHRREHAADYFIAALTLDPFMWSAYEQLCNLGKDIPPTAFFGNYPSPELQKEDVVLYGANEREAPVPCPLPIPTKVNAVVSGSPPPDYVFVDLVLSTVVPEVQQPGQKPVTRTAHVAKKGQGLEFSLTPKHKHGWPTTASSSCEQAISFHPDGTFKDAQANPVSPGADGQSFVSMPTQTGGQSARRHRQSSRLNDNETKLEDENIASGGVRRSLRTAAKRNNLSNLSNQQVVEASTNLEKPLENANTSPRNQGHERRSAKRQAKREIEYSQMLEKVKESLNVLALLRSLGEGLLLLSQYRCVEARRVFSSLPRKQQYTGWVLHQMGKAAFEMADYRLAQDSFEKMKQVAPSRTAGLEVYSTNLWHLKEEVALCYLAQEAMELDKTTPEAWCVIGNCFSLQKEHDVAIKFFQRALQLDPSFTYAYTLCGHEYVSNEDFEKAVACYRHAIRKDPRHYNAWYGLGTIYYRQEKYELAEYHFRRALNINTRSSVLYCYLGMVLHASHKCEAALKMLQYATDLEPTNPQARFQRANVLRTMECYEAALEELQAVRDSAPREASVHFLMGKICKQLGRRDEAMIHFTTALDLDPKDSNMIKLSIDKLDSSDVDEDDDL